MFPPENSLKFKACLYFLSIEWLGKLLKLLFVLPILTGDDPNNQIYIIEYLS